MTPCSLPADKISARRAIRTARKSRRAAASEQDWARCADQLAAGLTHWLAHRPMPTVAAVYQALPTEPPTAGVRDALVSLNIQLLVPVLLDDLDLSWQDLASGGDLGVDAIGSAGLIITPGLAVARTTGLRLGQGGGSYDRALGRVRHGTPVITMLFDEELVEQVPAEPHDLPVSAVLTPRQGVVPVGGTI